MSPTISFPHFTCSSDYTFTQEETRSGGDRTAESALQPTPEPVTTEGNDTTTRENVETQNDSVIIEESGDESEPSGMQPANEREQQVSDSTLANINASPEQETSDDTIANIAIHNDPLTQRQAARPDHTNEGEHSTTPAQQPNLPELVAAALAQMSARLEATMDTAQENTELRRQVASLTSQTQDLERQLVKIKEEHRSCLDKLEERSQSLMIERSLRLRLEQQMDIKIAQKDDLVIGSSIIRDLDETLYNTTKVIAKSGATPENLTSVLKAFAEEGKAFKKITIVAGGNQLQDEPTNVSNTTDSMRLTVAGAKEIGEAVAICELPPRLNSAKATEAIQSFNIELRTLAEETESELIETANAFHLANGQPNDGYMDRDSVHLNIRGAQKLVECLKISLKDSDKKVTKFAAYKQNHPQAPTPLLTSQPSRQAYAQVVTHPPRQQTGPQHNSQRRLNTRTERLSAQSPIQAASVGQSQPAWQRPTSSGNGPLAGMAQPRSSVFPTQQQAPRNGNTQPTRQPWHPPRNNPAAVLAQQDSSSPVQLSHPTPPDSTSPILEWQRSDHPAATTKRW